ncbi:MAG: PEGA domain-containing protein [Burkholderiales bacterium]|nr:PEGA domain-containing protein [Burkholderiales bacterium]
MEKVLAVGAATARLRAIQAETEEATASQASVHAAAGNAMCPVLFLEMIDFSRKSVSDQLLLRERFNGRVVRALEQVTVLDRMVLDTGEGVAIAFLGGPEAALHVILKLARSFQSATASGDPLQVRGGLNLGPVRVTRDAAGQPLVLGDGLNVAQRLLGLAAPGQFLISRAYHEALCKRFPLYGGLFLYQGSRTDSHVREHEVFELDLQAATKMEVPALAPAQPGVEAAAEHVDGGPTRTGQQRWALAVAGLSAVLLLAAVATRLANAPEAQPASVPGVAATKPKLPPPLERPLVLREVPLHPGPSSHSNVMESAQDEIVVNQSGLASRSPDAEPPLVSTPPAITPTPSTQQPATRTTARTQTAKRNGQPAAATAKTTASTVASAPRETPATAGPATAGPMTSDYESAVTREPETTAISTAWVAPAPVLTPAPAPVAPAASAPAKKPATALVLLAISPWGEVLVDGKSMGVSPPLTELELPQGKHRIVVRNAGFKPFDEVIELGSNQTMRIKHKFAQGG